MLRMIWRGGTLWEFGGRAPSLTTFSSDGKIANNVLFQQYFRCAPILEDVMVFLDDFQLHARPTRAIEPRVKGVLETLAKCASLASFLIISHLPMGIRLQTVANAIIQLRYKRKQSAHAHILAVDYPAEELYCPCCVFCCRAPEIVEIG